MFVLGWLGFVWYCLLARGDDDGNQVIIHNDYDKVEGKSLIESFLEKTRAPLLLSLRLIIHTFIHAYNQQKHKSEGNIFQSGLKNLIIIQ